MSSTDQHIIKLFKQRAVPDFKILQTQFVSVDGQKYSLVGQFILDTILCSHYDVFDQEGVPAEEKVAEKVYTSIAQLQITYYFEKLLHLFSEQQQKKPNQLDAIGQAFKKEHNIDIEHLLDNEQVKTLLQELIKEKHVLTNMEVLDTGQMSKFGQAWEAFWLVYESRMETLFTFREYVWNNNQNVKIQETDLHPIYQEADAVYQLFSNSLPASEPLISSVNDLIKVACQTGKAGEDDLGTSLLTPFEKFSKGFFKFSYRLLLWLLFPVSLIKFFADIPSGEASFTLPLNFLIWGIILFFAHVTDKRGRRTLISRRYAKSREERLGQNQLIRTKYFQAYEALHLKKQKEIEESYTFIGTPTIIWRILLFIGLFVILMGLVGKSDGTYDLRFLIVGIAILILRFVLPLLGFAHMEFQLRPGGLKIGNRPMIYSENIFGISAGNTGNVVMIDIGLQYRQKYKVKMAYRKDVAEQLNVWCDKHSIEFTKKFYL